MDSVKSRIARISKALKIALIVAKAVLILLMVVTAVQICPLFAQVRPASDFESVLGGNQLFESLRATAGLSPM